MRSRNIFTVENLPHIFYYIYIIMIYISMKILKSSKNYN